VRKTRDYILNHWEAIIIRIDDPDARMGCSAEGISAISIRTGFAQAFGLFKDRCGSIGQTQNIPSERWKGI
jgi:hypothetical protein